MTEYVIAVFNPINSLSIIFLSNPSKILIDIPKKEPIQLLIIFIGDAINTAILTGIAPYKFGINPKSETPLVIAEIYSLNEMLNGVSYGIGSVGFEFIFGK